MGRFDGVMLVSDYDGTLRGSTRVVLQRDIDAIRFFQQEGGTFLMCTGRCYSTFYQQARDLPLHAPTLLSNGATFCDMETGAEWFHYDLPLRAPEDIRVLGHRFPGVAFETYHGEDIYCWRPNAYTQWHMDLVKSAYTECEPEEMPLPWLKVLLEGEKDELTQVQEWVLSHWAADYECIFSNETLMELTAKGVHKGSGVLRAAETLGIAPEHIYCAGDNDNDVPMLTTAAVGFAPEGSAVAAKGLPGVQIVRDADHGCIESVIERLGEWYPCKE